jgi:hypothetical protein
VQLDGSLDQAAVDAELCRRLGETVVRIPADQPFTTIYRCGKPGHKILKAAKQGDSTRSCSARAASAASARCSAASAITCSTTPTSPYSSRTRHKRRVTERADRAHGGVGSCAHLPVTVATRSDQIRSATSIGVRVHDQQWILRTFE